MLESLSIMGQRKSINFRFVVSIELQMDIGDMLRTIETSRVRVDWRS